MNRRTLLRGMLGGVGVSLGLPMLDIFLDGHGEALADGSPLPLVFGTWSWGCGMNPSRWTPTTTPDGWVASVELAALAGMEPDITVLSGFDVPLDGRPNFPHHTGMSALRCGITPERDVVQPGASFDTVIAELLGARTPFRSLELTATGRASDSYSFAGPDTVNPSEPSPVALYTRIFGSGVGADGPFVPDPMLLLRRSVLSAVRDDTSRLQQRLGSHDRQRLDQYLTSVRQLEQRLELLGQEPPDFEACVQPTAPSDAPLGEELEQASSNHRALADLLVMALACDQTRVFNMMFSHGLSGLRQRGSNISHHQLTHDELIDDELGYQPETTQFVLASMEEWAWFVRRLADFEEGAARLLDRCMVLAHSDTALAKTHDIRGIPMMVAGGGCGAVRSGQHITSAGEPISRVGLTLMQVAGSPIARWGADSLEVSRGVSELLA